MFGGALSLRVALQAVARPFRGAPSDYGLSRWNLRRTGAEARRPDVPIEKTNNDSSLLPRPNIDRTMTEHTPGIQVLQGLEEHDHERRTRDGNQTSGRA